MAQRLHSRDPRLLGVNAKPFYLMQNLETSAVMKTYRQAQTEVLDYLQTQGLWDVKQSLKVPWAEYTGGACNGETFKLWFKARAVYLDDHSLHIDLRKFLEVKSPEVFERFAISVYRYRRGMK